MLSPQVREAAGPLVKAVAAITAPAQALAPAAESAEPQTLVLAQNSHLLAPALAVAPVAAASHSLVGDVAAPRLDLAPPEAARAVEGASAAAVAAHGAPVDPSEAAASFVQTYAAATAKNAIARWVHPICVRVEGLPDEQAGAAKARIEAVAREVGVKIQPAGCSRADIEVGFTKDAQGMLDDSFRTGAALLSDASGGAPPARIMTLPIQAWYQTNGMEIAANDTGGLKALADYRPNGATGLKVLVQCPGVCGGPPITTEGQPTGSFSNSSPALQPGPNIDGWAGGWLAAPGNPISRGYLPQGLPPISDRSRQFLNAFIIVDAKRIPNAKLGPVADYVAMLALSQSKSLGSCQVLPSIVDLFANCAGRAAPEGLTAADMAYLHALYGADHTIWAKGRSAVAPDVAKAMASRLSETKALAEAAPAPPERPIHPAAYHEAVRGAAQGRSPLLQLASLETSDPRPLAGRFVESNARVGQFGYTVRWQEPLCLKVAGLTREQNAAVVSRIDAVAQTLSQKVYSGLHQSCAQKNVWVLFTAEPQSLLDAIVSHNPKALGDAHSDTKGIRTVSRPIQAWRETECIWVSCPPEPFPHKPIETMVLVDAMRVQGAQLGAIADYVAMLVLADPRGLDQCRALPSVLDLFVGGCEGRAKPTGLTRGDLAYLKALYTAGSPITTRDWNWQQHGGSIYQVAGRMSTLLSGAVNLLSPGAKPIRHD
jgi:hypothetical protein